MKLLTAGVVEKERRELATKRQNSSWTQKRDYLDDTGTLCDVLSGRRSI